MVASLVAVVAPTAATAAGGVESYDGLSFRLQGCKGEAGLLPNGSGKFICADSLYTDGNLGKGWNELDLVPHRILIDAGNSAPASQTYHFDIAADNLNSGRTGYDFIENGFEAVSGCTASIGAQQTVGNNPQQIYREITVTQLKNTTCQLDLYIRLGLGSHLYPGSSLHSNLLNNIETTAGIGNKENSIPVNEIQPQSISKDMSATQGSDHVWDVTKTPTPADLDFGDTCAAGHTTISKTVQIKVEWTKEAATPGGDITVTTHVYATNPSHRTITVNVTDVSYSGTNQVNQVHSANSGDVDVPGNTVDYLVMTDQFTTSAGPSSFNDVATATYTDKVTGFPVPGTTTGTASATVQDVGQATNDTAVITDVESITGAGLSFSVDSFSGASGSFDGGYTAGGVVQPGDSVSWTSDEQSDSGSVTFDKTVYFDSPGDVSGELNDTATINGSDGFTTTADATVTIEAQDGCEPGLHITKTGPPSVTQGANATWTVSVSNTGNADADNVQVVDTLPNGFTYVSAIPTQGTCNEVSGVVTCNFGTIAQGQSASVDITATAPSTCGPFTNSASGTWGDNEQVIDGSPATSSGSVTGCETTPPPPPPPGSPALTITKAADAQTVLAGAPIGFTVTVSSTGSATATGVTLSDPLPSGSGISWSIAGGSGAAQCSISGSTLSCNFGDMAPGSSRSVHVTSPTTTDSCGAYDNTATASGTNVGSVQASASTAVDCPAIQVVKSAHPDHGAPGETITYKYVVTNIGTVDLFDISVDDDVLGHICDIPLLHPGESQTCTKDYVIPQDANISIKNVVIAKGHDAEGNEVQDDDTVTIDVILGATVTPKPTKTPPAGVAFTGSSAAIPLGGIALLLLMVGTALMWLGRRGRRPTAG